MLPATYYQLMLSSTGQGQLTQHEPPYRRLVCSLQVRVHIVHNRQCRKQDQGADTREVRQQNRIRDLVRHIARDLELDRPVGMVRNHGRVDLLDY
jgi:hypothetical protein